ncbi:MAG: MarR family winged helix-turn-helix transcriptional regulator [Streptosporangiaceae bacterium]
MSPPPSHAESGRTASRDTASREAGDWARASQSDPDTEILQAVTRVLAGVALQSLEALGGQVSLAQFRLLAVLGDLGPTRSGRVARALGLEASTVTRLADRVVASGHVIRGTDPEHRGVVTLELTASGKRLVTEVAARRRHELDRMLSSLSPGDRRHVIGGMRLLVEAAGEGHGSAARNPVPL